MSMSLDLPAATSEDGFIRKHRSADVVPTEELELMQVVIMGRIISRNLKMQRNQRRYHHDGSEAQRQDAYKETEDIDQLLKRAVKLFPPSWWVLPTLGGVSTDLKMMEETGKIVSQMHHYFL